MKSPIAPFRSQTSPITRIIVGTAAAFALIMGPTALAGATSEQPTQVAQGCYNGVMPLAPGLQSCSLPAAQPRVAGAAPDAGAIIACRHHPGCLSWYVNTPR
jgi:hypothetical protein